LAVLPCRVFAGLRLMVPRRLTSCSPWADDRSLAQQQVCCAAQQISARKSELGHSRRT
jgi:hypothetical protein